MNEGSPFRAWLGVGAILIALLTTSSGWTAAAQIRPALPQASVGKALFCGYGSVGLRPLKPTPEYELWFAVAVVEIDSPRDIANIGVSDFVVFDRAGKVTRLKRVVQVEEFNRARVAGEGSFAYYLNPGGTQAWDGTLRAGRMRLRVRVSLVEEPLAPMRFRLTVGGLVIEGPVDGEWPT